MMLRTVRVKRRQLLLNIPSTSSVRSVSLPVAVRALALLKCENSLD